MGESAGVLTPLFAEHIVYPALKIYQYSALSVAEKSILQTKQNKITGFMGLIWYK